MGGYRLSLFNPSKYVKDQFRELYQRTTRDPFSQADRETFLQKASDSIVATFRKRLATGLQSGRGFTIPDRQGQATDTTDFELVTWLVIKKNHPHDGGVS
jgi:hypothetical protein